MLTLSYAKSHPNNFTFGGHFAVQRDFAGAKAGSESSLIKKLWKDLQEKFSSGSNIHLLLSGLKASNFTLSNFSSKDDNSRNSSSFRFLLNPKSQLMGKEIGAATNPTVELWNLDNLNSLGTAVLSGKSSTQGSSQNLTLLPFPTSNLWQRDTWYNPDEMSFQRLLHDPLRAGLVSYPFSSYPYLLLITTCHKEALSKGNLHNHFPSIDLFLANKFSIPSPPFSLLFDTISHLIM